MIVDGIEPFDIGWLSILAEGIVGDVSFYRQRTPIPYHHGYIYVDNLKEELTFHQYLSKFGWKLAIPTNSFSAFSERVIGILKSFTNWYNSRAVAL